MLLLETNTKIELSPGTKQTLAFINHHHYHVFILNPLLVLIFRFLYDTNEYIE